MQDSCFEALCQVEGVDGPQNVGFNGLDRIVLIMDGRSRAGQVIDLIHFPINWIDDVMPDQFEARVGHKMDYVFFSAGKKVVQTKDFASLIEESFAEV